MSSAMTTPPRPRSVSFGAIARRCPPTAKCKINRAPLLIRRSVCHARRVKIVRLLDASVFRRVVEGGFGRGDTAVIDELVSPDFVEHEAGPLQEQGREGLKTRLTMLHEAFPGLRSHGRGPVRQ